MPATTRRPTDPLPAPCALLRRGSIDLSMRTGRTTPPAPPLGNPSPALVSKRLAVWPIVRHSRDRPGAPAHGTREAGSGAFPIPPHPPHVSVRAGIVRARRSTLGPLPVVPRLFTTGPVVHPPPRAPGRVLLIHVPPGVPRVHVGVPIPDHLAIHVHRIRRARTDMYRPDQPSVVPRAFHPHPHLSSLAESRQVAPGRGTHRLPDLRCIHVSKAYLLASYPNGVPVHDARDSLKPSLLRSLLGIFPTDDPDGRAPFSLRRLVYRCQRIEHRCQRIPYRTAPRAACLDQDHDGHRHTRTHPPRQAFPSSPPPRLPPSEFHAPFPSARLSIGAFEPSSSTRNIMSSSPAPSRLVCHGVTSRFPVDACHLPAPDSRASGTERIASPGFHRPFDADRAHHTPGTALPFPIAGVCRASPRRRDRRQPVRARRPRTRDT